MKFKSIKQLLVTTLLLITPFLSNAQIEIGPDTGGQSTHGNVFVAIVTENRCGYDQYQYSIYATTTIPFAYDMHVQAAVIKGRSIIEAKNLIIPAGQHVSNNVGAFAGASSSYGSVVSKPLSVIVNGAIDNNFTLQSISYGNIKNCFMGSSSNSNCYSAINLSAAEPVLTDNPETGAANEGYGDQDHDGVCNAQDNDDNGNGVDDIYEDPQILPSN